MRTGSQNRQKSLPTNCPILVETVQINGIVEASGVIAGGFDLTKSYRVAVYGQDDHGGGKSIQSMALELISPGDLTRDGKVNLEDLAELSGGWHLDYTMDVLLDIANNWLFGTARFSLSFDGVDDYVEIPGYKGITGTASRTCTAWIKTSSPSGEILTWGSEAGNGVRWIIRVNEGGQLRAEVQGGSIIGTTVINDGNWHHIAVVLEDDGSPDIIEAMLYVDGQPEVISASVDESVNTGSSQNVQIGVHGVAQRYFQGLIDDVRIYDRALSDVEIGSIENTQDGLVAYWDLNEGSGDTIQDSVSGYTGTIYGGTQWIPE